MDFIDYYLIVLVFIVALWRLRVDTQRYASTENITKIEDTEDHTVYVASGITDKENPGAKILMVMYSLYCRKCHSTNVFVELSDEDKSIHVLCRDCEYITRIKLSKLFVKHEDVK